MGEFPAVRTRHAMKASWGRATALKLRLLPLKPGTWLQQPDIMAPAAATFSHSGVASQPETTRPLFAVASQKGSLS